MSAAPRSIRVRRRARGIDGSPCWVVWVGKEKWAVLDTWGEAMQVVGHVAGWMKP